jgi:hypothetical protein
MDPSHPSDPSHPLPRFFAGRFAGEFENRLAAEFEASLPAAPPWTTRQV